MVNLTSTALLSAFLAIVNANIITPTNAQVGKLITLTWDLPEGVYPTLLTLQHGNGAEQPWTCVGCAALQYETLVQWIDAFGGNLVKGGLSIDWIPNVPGPAFFLQLQTSDGNSYGSKRFEILSEDGKHLVSAVDPGERHSNIMPQTATPIWYPNNPHKTASPSVTSTSTSSSAATTPTSTAASESVISSAMSTFKMSTITSAHESATGSAMSTSKISTTTPAHESATGSAMSTSKISTTTGTPQYVPNPSSVTVPTNGGNVTLPTMPSNLIANGAGSLTGSVFAVLLGALAVFAW